MSNTVQAAAEIRATLKREHGWSRRQVSVRADLYSMGSTIHVTIMDVSVPIAVVRSVVEPFEHVRHCEVTGEILCGGNTHVSLDYSPSAIEPLVAPIDALLATVAADPGALVELQGGWIAMKDPDAGEYWRAWRTTGELPELDARADIYCWGRLFCAKQIAIANINASAVAS